MLHRFEGKIAQTRRKPEDIERDRKSFLKRLEVEPPKLSSDMSLVNEYVSLHHTTIEWYRRRIRKELFHRYMFMLLSMALLLLVPVAIVWLGTVAAAMDLRDPGSVTAQITAALTGMIAVQRVLAQWLDKRKLVGHFHKASAALKDNVYTLEDTWRGRVFDSGSGEEGAADPKAAFLEDLKRGNRAARGIIADEEQNYFDTRAQMPTVDLGLLRSAHADAAALAESLKAPWLAQREGIRAETEQLKEGARAKRATVQCIQAELAALTKLMNDVSHELGDTGASSHKSELEARLIELRERVDDKTVELEKARHTLLEAVSVEDLGTGELLSARERPS